MALKGLPTGLLVALQSSSISQASNRISTSPTGPLVFSRGSRQSSPLEICCMQADPGFPQLSTAGPATLQHAWDLRSLPHVLPKNLTLEENVETGEVGNTSNHTLHVLSSISKSCTKNCRVVFKMLLFLNKIFLSNRLKMLFQHFQVLYTAKNHFTRGYFTLKYT